MERTELEKQVDNQINWTKEKLADSPISAKSHLDRGIGFVTAVGSLMKYNVVDLITKLEKAISEIKFN